MARFSGTKTYHPASVKALILIIFSTIPRTHPGASGQVAANAGCSPKPREYTPFQAQIHAILTKMREWG